MIAFYFKSALTVLLASHSLSFQPFLDLPLKRQQSTANKQQPLRATISPDASADGLPDLADEPLPLHTFAGKIEQAMKDNFGEHNIERVLKCWRLLEGEYEYNADVGPLFPPNEGVEESLRRQQCHSYVPGLELKEFWDTDQVEWAEKLESKFPAIRREFRRLLSSQSLQEKGNNVWSGALTEDATSYGVGWKTLVLMDRGVYDPTNCNLFPVTAKAVFECKVPAVEVFFASMDPHSEIQPHSDNTNFVLTSHMGLEIPYNGENKCRLRIGDTTRQWLSGQVTLFDTSILHEAVNESDQTRYILMMRVWHPDLTEVERHALQFIWDCLDNPALTSAHPDERKQAQALARARREFPSLQKQGGGGTKSGFGGGAAQKKKKNKNKK